MRIAVLTYHKAHNCGAMLQAWALQEFLRGMGHLVEFPSCNNVGVSPRWIKLRALQEARGFAKLRLWLSQLMVNLFSIGWEDRNRFAYNRFRRRFLTERSCTPDEFSGHYDCAIVGSDQVWHPIISKADTPLFLAENIPASVPVVSYAASFGDTIPAEPALERLLSALPRFKAISVREELAATVLRRAGFAAKTVLDPTFLLHSEAYRPLVRPRPYRKKYVFLYAVSLSDFVLQTARKLSAMLGLELVICGVYVKTRYHTPPECVWGVSPERMVTLIAHAEYVLASSFHGTALSVIFSKPFLSVCDQIGGANTRIATLLENTGLADRIVDPSISIEDMNSRLTESVNWTRVHERIEELRGDSIAYLKEALS